MSEMQRILSLFFRVNTITGKRELASGGPAVFVATYKRLNFCPNIKSDDDVTDKLAQHFIEEALYVCEMTYDEIVTSDSFYMLASKYYLGRDAYYEEMRKQERDYNSIYGGNNG